MTRKQKKKIDEFKNDITKTTGLVKNEELVDTLLKMTEEREKDWNISGIFIPNKKKNYPRIEF